MPNTIAEWNGNHPSHKAPRESSASNAAAMILDTVLDMSPETLVGSYEFLTNQVLNVLIEHDVDVNQTDAMDVRNWDYGDPEDIWLRLAGIYDALDMGCEPSGYYEDVSKLYHAHMDKFKVPSKPVTPPTLGEIKELLEAV